MSDLNQIQKEEKRATVIVNDDGEMQQEEEKEELRVGEISPKEYDYLLTMPLWSLSEEKVEELTRTMNNKKDDHDTLEATHINKLWDNDLTVFLEALSK